MSQIDGAAALMPEVAGHEALRKAEAARLKDAHDAEVNALIEATYHAAERALRSWCRDRDLVQDALHEAYLIARAKWPEIQHYSEPLGWVIKTARYKVLHERTRMRREAAVTPEDLPPSAQADFTDAWEAQETLRGWLQQLPDRWAEVYQMSREGFSNRDIARILGIADNSVRSYKAAAKRQLRQLAEEAGFRAPEPRRHKGVARGSR